jgi:hypothetical protein
VKVLELHAVVCVISVIGSTSVDSATLTTIGADTTDLHVAVITVAPAVPVGTSVDPSEATPAMVVRVDAKVEAEVTVYSCPFESTAVATS